MSGPTTSGPGTVQRALSAVATALLLAALAPPPPAAALDPDKPPTRYLHDVWMPEDGLPQVCVMAIAQTPDGYLWLGTQEGLARFDGTRFVVFDKSSEPAFTSNYVGALLQGRDGTLWIGTRAGGLLRYRDGRFTGIGVADGLSSDVVLELAESPGGTLWIGTDRGLDRLDGDRVRHVLDADGEPLGRVQALMVDRDGDVWVGVRGGGVLRVRDGAVQGAPLLPGDTPRDILQRSDGSVWIGAEGAGLVRVEGATAVPVAAERFQGEIVMALTEDRGGSLWIATMYSGLHRLTEAGIEQFSRDDGLSHDNAYVMLEDTEGSLWIGTAGGLNRLRDSLFDTLTVRDGLSANDVWSVVEDREGRLWIGTEDGLDLVVGDTIAPVPDRDAVRGEAVMTILEDRDGRLWIGTYGGGVRVLEGGRWRSIRSEDGLADDIVFVIVQDVQGVLWIGTHAGISRLAGDRIETLGPAEGLPHEVVRAAFVDRSGTVWFGTEGGGVAVVDGRGLHALQVLDDPDSAQQMVNDFYEDRGGAMWIATNGGLIRYTDGRGVALTVREGLFDDNIYRILDDGAGSLWMSCNRGLFRVPLADLEAVAEGRRAAVKAISYGRAQGMSSSECNGGSQPAGTRGRDGRLWFPTIAGVVAIDPHDIGTAAPPPAVLIEAVRIDGVEVDPSSSPDLPPGTRLFEFQYAAPTYMGPEQVTYRYRLSGVDDRFIDAGGVRVTHYNRPPPGHHEFRVVACTSGGICDDEGATFEFTLRPALHERRWFYPLIALAVFGLVVGVSALRIRRLRAREDELVAAVQERTAELLEATEELKELTLRDPLTGLRNRRFLFETVSDVLDDLARQCRRLSQEGSERRRSRDAEEVLAVYMVDVDHFKEVNDTHGHDAGDAVLRQISRALSGCVRGSDIVVRWGGEEFLVVLPRTRRGAVGMFAERIRSTVARQTFTLPGGGEIERTVSVGCAAFPFFGDPGLDLSLGQMIAVADLALFRAKRAGRNRSVRIQPGARLPDASSEIDRALRSVELGIEMGLLSLVEPADADAADGSVDSGDGDAGDGGGDGDGPP